MYTYVLYSVDVAGNVSTAGSPLLTVTIDTTAPSVPNAPILDPASDTGVSNSDDITADTQPTLDLSGYEACYRLFRDGVQISGDYGTAGAYTEASTLGDGLYSYQLYSVDLAGNVSGPAASLTVTINADPPVAPNAPVLDPASDSGISNSDDITNVISPTLDLSGFGADYYRLYRNDTQIGGSYSTAGQFTEAGPLPDGSYVYTLYTVDVAGNVAGHPPAWV